MQKQNRIRCRRRYEKVLVSITGASGIRYGVRLLEVLRTHRCVASVDAIITKSAISVAKHEEGIDLLRKIEDYADNIYHDDDMLAPYSSSSRAPDAMIIAPCSTKTLALIAHGIASTLTSRAALAVLRMKRTLIIVVREAPLGVIELENMLRVARSGAIVLPASPGFYHKPKTIDDLVDFIVGKILDVLQIDHDLYLKWRKTDKALP